MVVKYTEKSGEFEVKQTEKSGEFGKFEKKCL